MTQISSTGPAADGRGMTSADDERKPWLTALEARFAQQSCGLTTTVPVDISNATHRAEQTRSEINALAMISKFPFTLDLEADAIHS